MLYITMNQLGQDLVPKLKGTSLREAGDLNVLATAAANRMLARIDTQETRRTVTMATPLFDNVDEYALVLDYKRMIDIRPQVKNKRSPMYSQTQSAQFKRNVGCDDFSIKWNSGVRTLQCHKVPSGNCTTLDEFDGPTSNGSWSAEADAGGLYTEPLNYIQGNGALGLNLSGATGAGDIVNTIASVIDLSAYRYEDSSNLFVWIPLGTSARFTSFVLRRGSSSGNYVQVTVNTRFDGTAFTDGWNQLLFNWSSASTVGAPDNTNNTYRYFGMNYTAGGAIGGFLIDGWTNALGVLNEIEYYSEYLFRDGMTGAWKSSPTALTDLINVDSAAYEIFKTEMMVDITQKIRTGKVRDGELADWRLMLNGQPQSRYVKDPPYHGLYADYLRSFPSSAIPTITKTYSFDC